MRNFYFILLIILVQGCVSGPDISFDCIIDCNTDDIAENSPDYVGSVSYLPLDADGDAVFRNIDKISFENGLIYIADYKSGKIIVYTTEGDIDFVLDRKGRGPGEYLDIKSFTVDSDCLYILDNFNRKIFVYDNTDGTFIRSADIGFVAWDMEVFDNGDFAFAFSPMNGGHLNSGQPRGRILITDDEFRIKESLLEYRSGEYDLIGQLRYFSTYGEKLLYSSICFDGFIVFDREVPENREYVGLRFPRPIPKSSRLDEGVLDRNYNYLADVPILCDDYVMTTINDKSGYISNYMYNSAAGTWSENPEGGCKDYIYFPIASFDGSFVSLIDAESVYDELIATGFTRADEVTEKHLRQGNPVLLFYKMKI